MSKVKHQYKYELHLLLQLETTSADAEEEPARETADAPGGQDEPQSEASTSADPVPNPFLDSGLSEMKHGRRAGFSDEDVRILRTQFRPEIIELVVPTIGMVRDLLSRYPCLRKFTPKQLQDKVKSIVKVEKQRQIITSVQK